MLLAYQRGVLPKKQPQLPREHMRYQMILEQVGMDAVMPVLLAQAQTIASLYSSEGLLRAGALQKCIEQQIELFQRMAQMAEFDLVRLSRSVTLREQASKLLSWHKLLLGGLEEKPKQPTDEETE